MSSSSRALHVCSDFDNTIISQNSAIMLIRHYLLCGRHELFHKRLWRALRLFPKGRRQHNLKVYYSLLERMTKEERLNVVRKARLNPSWIEALKTLKDKYDKRTVNVRIISRNAADIIMLWIDAHKKDLDKHGIIVSGIVANNPVNDNTFEVVRKRNEVDHYDHVRFGLLDEKGKRKFLNKHTIYIGDGEERTMKDVVKEFIQV